MAHHCIIEHCLQATWIVSASGAYTNTLLFCTARQKERIITFFPEVLVMDKQYVYLVLAYMLPEKSLAYDTADSVNVSRLPDLNMLLLASPG